VERSDEARELLDRCLAGEQQAIGEFQSLYGPLIYSYPLRRYRVPAEAAGDFYVFAFTGGRIFRRAQTYEGRAPFRAYLLTVVLQHLFVDWRRATHDIDMISFADMDTLPDDAAVAPASSARTDNGALVAILLADLDSARAVILKLVHIEDCDLSSAEISYVSRVSNRSVPEVIAAVERLRATVREREAALHEVADRLEVVQAWLWVCEQRLQQVREELQQRGLGNAPARLQAVLVRLEARAERGQHQRDKLLVERRRRKVTAPYKDIAALLGTTVGNVASQIARARRELLRRRDVRQGLDS
jgi:RNA polymerase sigma factor (sigma-70 family)